MYTFYVLTSLSVISLLSCYVSGNSSTDFPEKSILRYGFQNTQECPDYEKAFICVQKCQDLNYDSAVSDKHCKCTCYSKPELQNHKIKSNTTRNDWKSGAPTTKLPIWAQTENTDKNNILDDDDDDHTTDDVDNKESRSPNENETSETHSAEDTITTEDQDDITDGNDSTQASSDDASNFTDANNTSNATDTAVDNDTPETDEAEEESNTTTTTTTELPV
ncbi:nucleolar transcription factor 1-B-like [Cydia strobilella]|uniref:nucleolar transcription factor 1-B-like n=1 Tax=Cydia strobilella TaxID=1100964 RepID=UPI003007DDFA